MSQLKEGFLVKGLFYFIVIALLIPLSFTTMIEGITIHLNGNSFNATIFYFISTIAFITAFWIYKRAIKELKTAEYLD